MEKDNKHIFKFTGKIGFRIAFLMVFIISVLLLLLLQKNYYNNYYGERDLSEFQSVLHEKQFLLKELFTEIESGFTEGKEIELLNSYTAEFQSLSDYKGISIFYFKNKKLAYWSDNTIASETKWQSNLEKPVFRTPNATYVTVNKKTKDGMLYGLVLVKTHYLYENEYLKNQFFPNFKLGSEVEIHFSVQPGLSPVYDIGGTYLFSLDLSSNLVKNDANIAFSFFFLILAILSVFSFFVLQTDRQTKPIRKTIWFIISVFSMCAVFFVVIFLRFPSIVFESSLFSPEVFANNHFPSLGHIWIFVMVILMVCMLYYWFFNKSRLISYRTEQIISFLTIIFATAWFIVIHNIGKSLVTDSTISFEVYKLNTLSAYTFFGFLIMLMGILAFCLLIDRVIRTLYVHAKKYNYLVYFSGLLFYLPLLIAKGNLQELLPVVFYTLIILAIISIRRKRRGWIKFGRYLPLLLIVAVFLTLDLQSHTFEKRRSQMEVQLAKISSEQDAVAEMLFSDLSDRLRNDEMMIRRLSYQIINDERILEYLQRNYFSGYWTKYDLRITVCRPGDDVFIEPPVGEWLPCFPFFESLILEEGISVENSDFYFLNNMNGRISYLGEIPYQTVTGEISLFIELDSKIISEELGYPTLLLKEDADRGNPFSFAKYNNGKLINSGGDFRYRVSPDSYVKGSDKFEYTKSEGYHHAIYRIDEENTVIVSIPIVTASDKLISFSYIFAMIFAVFSIIYLVVNTTNLKVRFSWDFKNKIQYSVIGVLFLTFVIICSGTIYFVKHQYRIEHQENLQSTMRSLYIELIHKVEYEDDLRTWSSDGYYNLDELLRKFSNVFYSDINMYDPDGFLLATSRAEIFNQKLLSNRMNRQAFQKLVNENYASFIHTEQIGKMTYQSAYVPLLNNENDLLAYLNLPYFTQPEILTQEVTNLVVAILNMYVFLMLLILFISVLLADRITQPLRFIQNRIAQVSLSRKNEKIIYNGKDEIAGLVDEYNVMVDELTNSAKLLAQSEREMAWREMAKQIAHEIKNPLTPMKLSIQHMQRMLAENPEKLEEQVAKVSQTLIEQIDSLSLIANEFSDFAKMPKARNRKIDVYKKLKNAVHLFESNDQLAIAIEAQEIIGNYTFGDPEQFQRVIINLLKNAIQAIPESRKKIVSVYAEKYGGREILIRVVDNGKGVPEEIRNQLFQPNFTTKSSGMGMGLAISANIINSMNGEIWYETEAGRGTTFFVKVPLI